MNIEEIKEKIDKSKENHRYNITSSREWFENLLDYITNLQQENKHLNLQLDQALKDYLNKEKQKKYLEIFMILDEIAKKEDIISFIYTKDLLTVQIGINDYYRIWINEEVN